MSGNFIDRDKEHGFEVRGRLIGRQAELDGDVVSGETCEAIAVLRRDIFVKLVAHNACRTVLAAARGHVSFLDAAQGERQLIDCGNIMRGAKTRAKRSTEGIREEIVGQEAIAVTQKVQKHRGPAVPEDQPEQAENHSSRKERPSSPQSYPAKRNQKRVPDHGSDKT